MEYGDVKIIRSRRRTMEIRVDDFGSVILRAPAAASEKQIRAFFESKREWAEKHVGRLKAPTGSAFSEEEVRAMADEALRVIPRRVRYFADVLGVRYGRITVRNQVTKWGSCTAGGNLNFNCMLVLMPQEILDGVILHELCHIKHMDHSADFYRDIYAVMPDYDVRRRWLSENGSGYMRRMRLYKEGGRRYDGK